MTDHDRTAPRRFGAMALVAVAGCALSFYLFQLTWGWEREQMEGRFLELARDRVSSISREIDLALQEIEAIGAFYAASPKVERHEFHVFVAPFLKHRYGIQALEWIPRVPQSRRAAYEEAARRDGFANFRITERQTQGRMVPAAEREEYFPVYFVEPYRGNEIALGFDLASDTTRLEGLRTSRDTGRMRATARITLVQETGKQFGFLVYLPVYRQGPPPAAAEERRKNLRGFALGVFRVGDILDRAMARLEPRGIDVHLFDISAPMGRQFLALHAASPGETPTGTTRDREQLLQTPLHHGEEFEIAGRTWTVICTPTPEFIAAGTSRMPWGVLGTGLCLTGLLVAYLSLILSRMTQTRRFALESLHAKEDMEREMAVRKRAEEDLKNSKQFLETVLNSVGDAISIIDVTDFTIVGANRSFLEIYGWKEEAVLGKPCYRVTHNRSEPCRPPDDVCPLLGALRTGRQTAAEHVHYQKDGKKVYVEVVASPIRDENGKVVQAVHAARDITDRKRMEDALRESEERFRSIAAAAQDAVLMIDDGGRLVYWNPAAQRIFGYSAREALGKDAHMLLGPARYHAAYEKGYAVFRESGPVISRTLELEAVRKDGSEFPIELSVSALKLQDKWHTVGILRDVTERKQHEEKLRKTSRALGAIHGCSSLLTRAKNEQQLLNGVCQHIVEQAGYRFVWVGFAEQDEAKTVRPVARAGHEDGYLETITFSWADDEYGSEPLGTAIRTGRIFITEDIGADPFFAPGRTEALQRGYGSVITLPLRDGENSHGVLSIYASDPNAFDAEEVELLKGLADDLAYGIAALRTREQHRMSEEKLAYQAFHDILTGLANRAMIMESLEFALARARRFRGSAAILFIDLDDFKLVNDTLGHGAGNELLRQVAERLRKAIRETDIVARQGGDEFIVLMASDGSKERRPGATAAENRFGAEAAAVARRIIERMKQPFLLQGQEAYVGATIGISLFPDDAGDALTLLQHADSAMYRAKELGKNNFQFYSRELSQRQQQRLSLASRLHKALEQKEFVLHYQPIVDLSCGRLIGVEALIRWQTSKGDLVSPADFLPVAEDTGLIIPIGDWVLEQACRQLRAWQEQGMALRVAVNLSVRQFWQGDITAKVLNVVTETGVGKDVLDLEITESAMILDPGRTEVILRQFRDQGLSISLDDFGTGYSSLNRLKRFPINKLKIDKSFVDGIPGDEDDAAIVTAITQLARNLGIDAVAEGIETVGQWRFLHEQGCRFGQGYYFSRPVPATEIEAMLKCNRRWALS